MLTLTQYLVYAAAAFLTFASHQVIPNILEKLVAEGGRDQLREIASGPLIAAFVRCNGVDHLVMAALLGVMLFAPYRWEPSMSWLLIGSAWAVAWVSVMSAVAIWAEAKK